MTDLRQGQGSTPGRPQTNNRLQETCQICYKEGHSANNCRKIIQISQQPRKPNLGTEILICQICKKCGHSADKCRFRDPQLRQPINVVQTNTVTCQLC